MTQPKSNAEVVREWLDAGEAIVCKAKEDIGMPFKDEATLFSICHKLLDACELIEPEPPGCDSAYLAKKAIEECVEIIK